MAGQDVGDSALHALGSKIDALKGTPLRLSILAGISLASFFTYYDVTNYAYVAPVLKAVWGVGDGEIAVGASMMVVGYVIGAFSITFFADAYGRRPAFILSVLILAAGSILAASSQSMLQMDIFRLLTGIGIGSEIAISSVYIGELSPRTKRGRYTSLIIVLGWIGLASSGPISLMLIQQGQVGGIEGWRVIMAIPGVAAFISLLLRLRMPESPRWLLSKGRVADANSVLASFNIEPIEESKEIRPAKRAVQFFRDRMVARRIALLAAVWFFVFVPVYASLLLVVEYVNQGFSLSQSISINVFGSVGFVAGGVASILVAERMERKYQIAAAGVLMAVGFILRGLLVHDYAGLVFAGFIAFAANAWLATSLYIYTAENFPTKIRSSASGTVEGTGRGVAAIGPFVFVMLQPFGFFNLMLGIALFSLAAAAVIVVGGSRTRGQSLEQLNRE